MGTWSVVSILLRVASNFMLTSELDLGRHDQGLRRGLGAQQSGQDKTGRLHQEAVGDSA